MTFFPVLAILPSRREGSNKERLRSDIQTVMAPSEKTKWKVYQPGFAYAAALKKTFNAESRLQTPNLFLFGDLFWDPAKNQEMTLPGAVVTPDGVWHSEALDIIGARWMEYKNHPVVVLECFL